MGCFLKSQKDYHNRNRRKRNLNREIVEELQINSTVIKTQIAGLRAKLVRELAKAKTKKWGQALTDN